MSDNKIYQPLLPQQTNNQYDFELIMNFKPTTLNDNNKEMPLITLLKSKNAQI